MATSLRPRTRVALVLGLAGGLLAGCQGPAAHRGGALVAVTTTTTNTTTTSVARVAQPTSTTQPVKATATTQAVTTTTVAPAAFTGSVATVTAADLPFTWRAGCPVAPAALRMLQLSYWGFDDQPHVGSMVVNTAVTGDVIKVFAQLFAEHFPIHQMQPEDAYHGSDPVAMAADDTSGFNCRYAVAPGPPQWSAHAYGEAIDVNTVENPYVEGGTVMPVAGAAFVNRADFRPGMAVPGGQLTQAFASVGWFWGGRWSSPDYQHFSKTGG